MALPTKVSRSQRSDPFDLMQREFGNMLGRFWGDRYWGEGEQWNLAPFGVDVREDNDHIYVEADLPGFRKEDVDITLENGALTISAEKRDHQEAGKEKGDYLLRERRYQQFVRSFTLPSSIDEQHVDAKLDNGCLIITLNKSEQSKPRKITIGGEEHQQQGRQSQSRQPQAVTSQSGATK